MKNSVHSFSENIPRKQFFNEKAIYGLKVSLKRAAAWGRYEHFGMHSMKI